jgi:two-component system, NarL family, response regulator NreC
MFTILLVDDVRLWTDLMADAFVGHPFIQFADSVATERQLIERLACGLPDLLLLDLCLDTKQAINLNLARQLKEMYPTLRIVLLTDASKNVRLIQEANKMGLAGYVSKNITKEALVGLLLKAQQGQRIFSDDVKDILVELNNKKLPELTPREHEILVKIDMGMTRASIMEELNMRSPNTYDAHVHHIKEKLGAKSTSELRRKAVELGYL